MAENQSFKTVLDVVDYLTGQGWKVGKSAAYQHVKEGKLPKTKTGQFSLKTVERYANNHLDRVAGPDFDPVLEDWTRKKVESEARKAQAQAVHWETKTQIEQGKYVPVEAFEQALAARALVFKSDLMNFCNNVALDLCSVVDGNAEKIPDLMEFLQRKMELLLDRYSQNTNFDVPKDEN